MVSCQVRRARAPTPKGLTIGELPVVSSQRNQRARRAGWFAALVTDDDEESKTDQADDIDIEHEGSTPDEPKHGRQHSVILKLPV